MEFRKLGFRFEAPGPFWFEDLMFFVVDESRRLPERAVRAATATRSVIARALEAATSFDPTELICTLRTAAPAHATPHRADSPEIAPLDEPEAWALATEPLIAANTGANAALTCHTTAAEQLDSLAYVLARIRDDLRPIMTTARFKDETVEQLPNAQALETSIEALLELSRKCAATRPKDRVRTAA